MHQEKDKEEILVYVLTENVEFSGSHCLDIKRANLSDPVWLIKQRKEEVEVIKGWINQYYKSTRILVRSKYTKDPFGLIADPFDNAM